MKLEELQNLIEEFNKETKLDLKLGHQYEYYVLKFRDRIVLVGTKKELYEYIQFCRRIEELKNE